MTRHRTAAAETGPNYRICYRSTGEPVDALPMHVLAHAYLDAWRLRHASGPTGRHVIEMLDLVIVFGPAKKQGKR